MLDLLIARKKQLASNKPLVPLVFARLRTREGQQTEPKTVRVLLDSGASATLVTEEYAKHLTMHDMPEVVWETKGGTFSTTAKVNIQFTMPELSESKLVTWHAYVDKTSVKSRYDMIIGRDLMKELGIVLNFRDETIEWDESCIPMKPVDATYEEHFHVTADTDGVDDVKRILPSDYKPADIDEYVSEQKHLSNDERAALCKLLKHNSDLFDGTLGKWKGKPADIELKEGVKPYHGKPYTIPKAYEQTLRVEVERLCKIGVLRKVNRSEWGAPTFIIPKKNQTVRFITDLREVNKRVKRKPFPLPKIQDLLLKLEGFMYATALDLNMGYYHIELTPNAKRICTIVLPWGKYEYQRMPMGLCKSTDIFQEHMSELMEGLNFVRAYLDDLLVITNGSFTDHLEKLQQVFTRLRTAGFKINIKKSYVAYPELEYLGYWITRNGIKPVDKKVLAIQKIAAPQNRRQLRRFIGLINYYRDVWPRRSELLAPLSALTSTNVKWRWTEREQDAFEKIKKHLSRDVLLRYPDFNQPFDVHTDASDTQLGAVISQDGKPIAYYSRKLIPAQTRYTVIERELLSIVETFKEFRNILLGHHIRVYTDHKNLTCTNFNTDRVLRWRLLLEEYAPEIIYLQGEQNVAADALSRLPLDDTTVVDESLYALDLKIEQPISYRTLAREQSKDKKFDTLLSKTPYTSRTFHGGGKSRTLICHHDKIAVPETVQQPMIRWYHEMLCHPGQLRMESTIRQHFHWPTLREDVRKYCTVCDTCQRTKKGNKKEKYGLLPEKEAEAKPWDVLCVDLIGPYTFYRKRPKKNLTLHCVTMIDPATGWFEIAQIADRSAVEVADVVERTWLTRYPWPTKIIMDRGKEFLAEFSDMVTKTYGAVKRVISTKNPQANAIIERVHQTLGNMVRSKELAQDLNIDEADPFGGTLSAVSFAVRATVHTTLQATPAQLVFGRDLMLNIPFEADWQMIRKRKQDRIRENNLRENAKRTPHTYKVGDRVLVYADARDKLSTTPYQGPYEVRQVNTNGTVRLRMGAVTDTVNIRRIHPYRE